MTDLEIAAIAAYEAFAQSTADRMGEMPPWQAIPPDARADWRAVADAVRMVLYAKLGNEHWVIFTEDGWTVEHSIECRLSGHMHECGWHNAIKAIATEYDPDMAGRWRITGIDSEGLPSLERAP
jgi:Family of unknown function (DUF6085)